METELIVDCIVFDDDEDGALAEQYEHQSYTILYKPDTYDTPEFQLMLQLEDETNHTITHFDGVVVNHEN